MRPHAVTFATLLILASSLAASAARTDPWLPAPGDYDASFRFEHGSGSKFFADDGEKQDNPFGILVESRSFESVNELGWKRWMSATLALPLQSVSIRTRFPEANDTQTGLSDLDAGVRIKLLGGGRSAMSATLDWRIPLGYDRQPIAALGDGLHHVTGGLELGTSFPAMNAFLQGGASYGGRFDVRVNPKKATRHVQGDVIGTFADLGVWLGNSLLLAGRYQGAMRSADEAGVEANAYVAGPDVTFRVDDHMDVFAGARFPIAGRNSRVFSTYYAGFALKQTHLNRLQGFHGDTRRPS